MSEFCASWCAEDIGFDSDDEIETQFGEVCDFVHGEEFVWILWICVGIEGCDDEPDAAQSSESCASASDIGQEGAIGVSEDDAFDVAISPEDDADFTVQRVGDTRHAMSHFASDEEVWGALEDTDTLNGFEFVGAKPLCMTKNRGCHFLS